MWPGSGSRDPRDSGDDRISCSGHLIGSLLNGSFLWRSSQSSPDFRGFLQDRFLGATRLKSTFLRYPFLPLPGPRSILNHEMT